MTGTESVACVLCGTRDAPLAFVRADGGRVVECLRCGLAYLNPRPHFEGLRRLYSSEAYFCDGRATASYDDYFTQGAEALADPRHESWRLAKRLVREGGLSGGGPWLDVGCGGGFFLVAARTQGARVAGVELSPFAAEYGRRTHGLDIRTGTLEEAGFPDGVFRVVTMLGVIEHLPDPLATLREVRRVLQPRGLLGILTPNYGCTRLYGASWLGFRRSFEHIYFFSPRGLKRLFGAAGFRMRAWESIESIDGFHHVSPESRLLRTALQVRDGFARLRLWTALRPVWRMALAVGRWGLARGGFSHTLLAIAERRGE